MAKHKCTCNDCIAGLTDHERRITKLENKKKSKMPAWFQEWNDHAFTPLVEQVKQNSKDIQYLKENTVMKDDFKSMLKEELKILLKPSAFKDSK